MEDKCLHAFHTNKKQEAVRPLQLVKHPRDVKSSSSGTLLHWAAAWGWTDIVECFCIL